MKKIIAILLAAVLVLAAAASVAEYPAAIYASRCRDL